jgi:hypothetical protein
MPRGAEALGFGPRCKATVVGAIAARALRNGAHGHVRACFEHSLYLQLGSGFLCLGGENLGAGPLNLLCRPMPEGSVRPRLNPADAVRIEGETLVAGELRIELGDAVPWSPAPVGTWDRSSLARGLAAAKAALGILQPQDGLALLAPGGRSQHGSMARVAAAPIDHLGDLLRAEPTLEAAPDAARIAPLVGLGPGLTPSGDDVLGGLLVALALVGRIGLRDRLWRALHGAVAERTTEISRAHLAAAAEGQGGAQLHSALSAIMRGASAGVEGACAALGGVGHTSGWDALAGGLLVLETTAKITN